MQGRVRSAGNAVVTAIMLALAGSQVSLQQRETVDSVLVVPRDLYEYAQSLGCDQVSEFYERSGVSAPPFLYVEPAVPWQDTASALWCRPQTGPAGRFTLLFRFGPSSGSLGRCPIAISNQEHIGGLSVDTSVRLLNDFVYSDDRLTPGPSVPMPIPAIRSEYDGVGKIYACYGGRWLEYAFH